MMASVDSAYQAACGAIGVETDGVALTTLPAPFTRGLVATRNISPTECMVSVPLSAALHVRSSRLLARELCASLGAALREDDALALSLVMERAAGDSSYWAAHVAALPLVDSSPFFWMEQERDALPAGSSSRILFARMQTQLEEDHGSLCTSILSLKRGGGGDVLSAFTLEAYRWAMSIIWSRFVSVAIPDDTAAAAATRTVKCMLPFFDMANHDASSRAYHEFNVEAQCIRLHAGQASLHASMGFQAG